MFAGAVAAISGIQAYQRKLDAHAHNIANAQTPEYEAVRVTMVEREGGGVDAVVSRDESPGPILPDYDAERIEERREAEEIREEELREGSNVDLAEELVGMAESARMMELQMAAYRRQDEALGTMLDTFA